MASKDNVVIVNEGFELRTSKSGRTRGTLRIKAEPLAIDCDPKSLGAGIADALALHYRNEIKSISAPAAAATLKAREVAERAYDADRRWATKRYAGGKLGSMRPNQTSRAFNDSGRFASSIRAYATRSGSWLINVAANRLDASTAGSLSRIYRRLVQLVPSIANVALALADNDVLKARVEATAAAIKKGKPTTKPVNLASLSKAFDFIHNIADSASDQPDPTEQEEAAQ